MTTVSVLNMWRRNWAAVGCWLFCWAMWDMIPAFAQYLSCKNLKMFHGYTATGNRRKHAELGENHTEKISRKDWNQKPWRNIVENYCVKPAKHLLAFLFLHPWLISLNLFTVLWMHFSALKIWFLHLKAMERITLRLFDWVPRWHV